MSDVGSAGRSRRAAWAKARRGWAATRRDLPDAASDIFGETMTAAAGELSAGGSAEASSAKTREADEAMAALATPLMSGSGPASRSSAPRAAAIWESFIGIQGYCAPGRSGG